MFVVKRDGRQQEVHFDKITARIMKLSYNLNPEFCDPVRAGGRGEKNLHKAVFVD
jgi:ribonucleoside-diphosphate reductase subunit M1